MTALDVSYGDSMREVSRPRLLFRCPVPRRIRSEIPKFLWMDKSHTAYPRTAGRSVRPILLNLTIPVAG